MAATPKRIRWGKVFRAGMRGAGAVVLIGVAVKGGKLDTLDRATLGIFASGELLGAGRQVYDHAIKPAAGNGDKGDAED